MSLKDEIREAIEYADTGNCDRSCPSADVECNECLSDYIFALIKPYIKPQGEPPILSDEEIGTIGYTVGSVHYTGGIGYQDRLMEMGKKIASAQRDADKKHYEGK